MLIKPTIKQASKQETKIKKKHTRHSNQAKSKQEIKKSRLTNKQACTYSGPIELKCF